MFFNLLLDDFPSLQIGTIKMPIGTIKMPIGTNNWDVDTYRNKLENQIRIQNLQVTCFPSGE